MDHMGHDLTPVLVTGADGYLAQRVMALLSERKIPFVGTSRRPKRDLLICELTDRAAVQSLMRRTGSRQVIHCAAVVPRNAAGYADIDNARDNLRMVENLLGADTEHIVFVSSMTVYPDRIEVAREENAAAEGAGYAASKLRAEELLIANTAAVATILRLPGLFGPPRQGGVLFNAAYSFACGRIPHLDSDLPRWSALHVDDAAALLVRAVQSTPGSSRVMNAGYSGPMSIADAVHRIARRFGVDFDAGKAKWFSFDLARLKHEFGPAPDNFDRRLDELTEWVHELAARQAVR